MNLPNKITVFRVCMIPLFLIIYLMAPFGMQISGWMALVVFIIASFSDFVDGKIARERNMVTNFGKLMDPLADKLLVAAAMIAMAQRQLIPSWVAVIIISRELFITGFRQLVLEQDAGRVVAASFWAKIKTVMQMAMVCLLLMAEVASVHMGIMGQFLVYATVLVTVLSAVEYLYKNKVKWDF